MLRLRLPPTTTPLPYTTLFRSLRVRSGNPVSGLVVAERLDQLIDFHAVHRTDEAVADEHDDRAHNRGCDGQSLLGRRAQFGDWPGEDVLVDCENDQADIPRGDSCGRAGTTESRQAAQQQRNSEE